MVIVSERSIERLLKDVAPKVQRLTQWDPHLDDLTVRLVSKAQFFEHVTVANFQSLGIETAAASEKGKKSAAFSRLFSPYLFVAQYVPQIDSMFINSEVLGAGTNESGLAVTLGHELTHRCQFENYPRLTEAYGNFVRRVVGKNVFDIDGDEQKNALDTVQAYMTLIEGDASLVEGQLKKMFYQDAKVKISPVVSLIGLAMMAPRGMRNGQMKKLKQYQHGEKIVGQAYALGGRQAVNRLYELDELQMRRLFG